MRDQDHTGTDERDGQDVSDRNLSTRCQSSLRTLQPLDSPGALPKTADVALLLSDWTEKNILGQCYPSQSRPRNTRLDMLRGRGAEYAPRQHH